MNFYKSFPIWICCFLFLMPGGIAATFPEGFIETRLAEGLNPTAMTIAPDGRIFILEKNGRVLVVENDELLTEPLIELAVDDENERGLGGIVLDPDFETNQYFYLYYTVPGEDHNRVSRFTADNNAVVEGSEVTILDLDILEGSVHNGGAMGFGADGKLFIATGDGAHSDNAQDLNSLLGKILRINKDGSIPEDNPFYGQTSGKNRAIWALGLRNPFSFAIDPVTGIFLANDVGQSGWEEINVIEKGKNYGWPMLEGKNRKGYDEPENYQEPLFDYDHEVGCSIIGAAFYNPETYTFPEKYHGKYFFADYCKGFIKVLDPESGEELETFATDIDRPLAFVVAPDGSFYYLERGRAGDNTSASQGALVKVTYSGDLAPYISVQPASQEAAIGEEITFQVKAGGKEPLSYQWYKNDEAIEGEEAAELTLTELGLEDDGNKYYVEISNEFGSVRSETAVLSMSDNTAPEVVIDQLIPDRYKAGETIQASGYATDEEDGELPTSSLSWKIDFHHDDHHHPALEWLDGESNISYDIPRVGETSDNVWYRVHLRATDSHGKEISVYKDIFPLKADFEVQTQPEGLTLYIDGAPTSTPETTTGVVGVSRSIRAPASQEVEGTLYFFEQWSDESQELERSFNVPEENSSWVAIYQEVAPGTGDGLAGAYYADENSEEPFSGEPLLQRIDPQVDFDWSTETAAPEIPADHFEVRWTGSVQPLDNGEHIFYVKADDGARLWVNESLIIDRWSSSEEEGSAIDEASIGVVLEAGQLYDIKLEYYQEEEGAFVQLEWSSDGINRTLIPTSQLYSSEVVTGFDPGLAAEASVTLYPVPADNILNIRMDDPSNSLSGKIFIMNNIGSLIMKRQPVQVSVDSWQIDVSGLAPGIYYLWNKENNSVFKFLKE